MCIKENCRASGVILPDIFACQHGSTTEEANDEEGGWKPFWFCLSLGRSCESFGLVGLQPAESHEPTKKLATREARQRGSVFVCLEVHRGMSRLSSGSTRHESLVDGLLDALRQYLTKHYATDSDSPADLKAFAESGVIIDFTKLRTSKDKRWRIRRGLLFSIGRRRFGSPQI